MALSEMPRNPVRHAHKPCKTCMDWRVRLIEYEVLRDMQHARVNEAIKHFRHEKKVDYHPDLGELVAWLMDKAGLCYDGDKCGLGKSDPKLHKAWRKKWAPGHR